MSEAILVINAGSSSIKFSVFISESHKQLDLKARGQVEGIGVNPNFVAKDLVGKVLEKQEWTNSSEINHTFLMKHILHWIEKEFKGIKIKAAGHRVVHGGVKYAKPVLMTSDVFKELEKLSPLAPLHQPHNLAAIKALQNGYPDLPQVACFDTAFHRTNPNLLQYFFIPREYFDEGVRKYGFHGLSYEYIAESLKTISPELADKKVVIAHLGSGASLCVIDKGRSVTTSMGLTALDGVPMGTRPGNLDVGVLLYLMREKKMGLDELENLLYKKSGLLGLSQINNDMRVLEQSDDPRAKETLEAYSWRVCQMIGSLAAANQGIDGLIFTAGIGENSPIFRKMICEKLQWLGLDLDVPQNAKNERVANKISTTKSKLPIWVIPTNEELMIAQHTLSQVHI